MLISLKRAMACTISCESYIGSTTVCASLSVSTGYLVIAPKFRVFIIAAPFATAIGENLKDLVGFLEDDFFLLLWWTFLILQLLDFHVCIKDLGLQLCQLFLLELELEFQGLLPFEWRSRGGRLWSRLTCHQLDLCVFRALLLLSESVSFGKKWESMP